MTATSENFASMSLERVGFAYGRRALLTDIDLALYPGEVLGVLGPNGAGKSTLLKLLTGDLKPNSGTIRLGTQDLRDVSALDQALVRAVMPQQSELRFALTGRQVVMLGRSPHHGFSTKAENEQYCREALLLADASEFADRPYPSLSGGERQRIHLARAITQIMPLESPRNRFLLLDEPTSNLDLEHQQTALTVARKLASKKVGVLAVLHDLNLAAHYCDRLVVLHDGGIAACGSTTDVLTVETISRSFNVHVDVLDHPSRRGPLVVTTDRRPDTGT